jgi:outer membrane scaffolding protein for murein synthesis (MipA/OmpV family)
MPNISSTIFLYFLRVSCLVLSFSTFPVFAQVDSNVSDSESLDRNLTGFEALNEAQPLWEFGAGGVALSVANYPASSERNFITLAAPYIVYRGDVFRIGGGHGARAVLLEKSDFEIDLSFGGAFSAESKDNTVRQGMPELEFLFEVGPQLIYKLTDITFDGGGKARLNTQLQTRGVFSTDFNGLDQRGYVIESILSYQQRGVWLENTGLNISFSLTYASEKLQDYFYQVDSSFATNNRDQYDAKGGYLGSELSVGLSFPLADNIRGFFGGSVKFHQGAANIDSPLYEKDITYSLGLGFVWRLYQSETKASW